VDSLGDGVVPVAWAEDGIVEAVEVKGDAWVLGVQWEIQESWKSDDRFLAVFAAFAERARRRLTGDRDDDEDARRAVPGSA
jgi:putative glutamine amidotransferase